jgi:predicted NAD/FAD-binding protein
MDTHTHIAIIGTGIAGLNGALTLQDAGLACGMYEASNRIGGRKHSDTTTWADGMVSKWCGEFIDSDHNRFAVKGQSALRAVLREFFPGSTLSKLSELLERGIPRRG